VVPRCEKFGPPTPERIETTRLLFVAAAENDVYVGPIDRRIVPPCPPGEDRSDDLHVLLWHRRAVSPRAAPSRYTNLRAESGPGSQPLFGACPRTKPWEPARHRAPVGLVLLAEGPCESRLLVGMYERGDGEDERGGVGEQDCLA
jgi:hypothetical protein